MELHQHDYFETEPHWDDAPCGLVVTETDGTILKCNTTFASWTGVRRDSQCKYKLGQFLSAGSKIFFEIRHIPLLNLKGCVAEVRYDLLTAQGTTQPVLVNSVVRESGEHKTFMYAFTEYNNRSRYAQDLLEEKKKVEAELRNRTEYISLLSHEIRTPLQIINSVTQLLQTPGPRHAEYLDILKQSTDTLLQFANNLLHHNKLESSGMMLSEARFNIRELVRDVVALFKVQAESKGLRLKVNVDKRIEQDVIGDVQKLKQVFVNLLGNAIKFTNAGSVELSVASQKIDRRSMTCRVSVTDTGEGIAPEEMDLIFQPFGQTESTRRNNIGGTGLGLDISRRIVELFGSTLQVTTSGSGTSFFFDLTMRFASEEIVSSAKQDRSRFAGNRILVADDNEVNLILTSHLLNARGIETVRAVDGIRAWENLLSCQPDLVLMDLQMPLLDGMQLLEKIRRSEIQWIKDLPVIAVSGDQDFDYENAKTNHGLTDYMLKPFTAAHLDETLNKYLPVKSPAPGKAVNIIADPVISFEKIAAITNGDLKNYCAILKETARALKEDKTRLEAALKSRDTGKLKALTHKCISVCDYFHATRLRGVLESTNHLLANGIPSDDQVEKATEDMNHEIRCVLEFIGSEINRSGEV